MSQYQDYFFSDVSVQGQYSMLQSPMLCNKTVSKMNYLIDNDFFKQNHETIDPSYVTEIANKSHQSLLNKQENVNNKNKRAKHMIQIGFEYEFKRTEVIKGLKDDTTQLNTNFKTILSKNLKELVILKQVRYEETQLINQFIKAVPSFSAIKLLCQSSELKYRQVKLLKSAQIAQDIMKSSSSMQNKLTMLKYVQCLKGNFQSSTIIKWKGRSN